MELELITGESENFLCDRYKVTNLSSQEELLVSYKRLAEEVPDHAFLVTLDNLDQACYTSMHAKMAHHLDDTDGHDLSSLSAVCFKDGEHKGYLTSKEEFFIRKSNFLKRCSDISIDDAFKKEIGLYEESIDDFIEANNNILSIMDERVFILKVPVENSYETLFAFPNGYFSCDLNPFETYLLSKHMQQEFGYRLMGIGASYIAFIRTRKASEIQIDQLTEFISKMYSDDVDSDIASALKSLIRDQEILVLRYIE